MKKKFILALIFAAFIAKEFTQISPCRVGLEYDKSNNSNSDVSFPFKMNSLFLVNAEVGWLKFMGDYFFAFSICACEHSKSWTNQ